jgi:carboxyl-terminal processing protease
MTNRSIFLLLFIGSLLYSCQPNNQSVPSKDGVWRSIGYGKILKIESEKYSFYDITQNACLPVQQGNISTFGMGLTFGIDTLSILKGTGLYQYIRVKDIPELCNQSLSEDKKKDPIYNFEVMAKTIEAHFAYFERNQINWDSLYNASKAKITSETTEPELYLVLEEIIDALRDNHGSIEPADDVYEQAEILRSKPEENLSTKELPEYGDFQIGQMVAESFLANDMTSDTWLMHWGKMEHNIGYIQVKSMWLFADLNLADSLIEKNGFVDTYAEAFSKMNERDYIEQEKRGISSIMERIMNDLKDTEYIILDVRFNGGGQDAVSMEILRRFNDHSRKVATKKATKENAYTKEVPIFLEPAHMPYIKPVYLLTSQQSASATDFMALASLELEKFKRIGAHTNGALSDAMERRLPNGWYFSISNEVYTDLKGVCYESIGIPVDYELNYPEDRQSFFRSIADDLEGDKKNVLKGINKLRIE